MSYQHRIIEKKWQEYWDKNETFKAKIVVSIILNIMR